MLLDVSESVGYFLSSEVINVYTRASENLIHKFDGVWVAPYILFRDLFCLAGPRTVQDRVHVQKGGGVFKYLIDLVLSVRIIPGIREC